MEECFGLDHSIDRVDGHSMVAERISLASGLQRGDSFISNGWSFASESQAAALMDVMLMRLGKSALD